MAVDWREVVRSNVRAIVRAAKDLNHGDETVCVLLDLDSARSAKASAGALQLIADTQLRGAIPMPSMEGHRIACLPITLHALVESVGSVRERQPSWTVFSHVGQLAALSNRSAEHIAGRR